jgi:methylenetetrahydrofolate dehydrogenase (NADP+)/methenyltetrahydrofolate cyclohydrolase
MTPTNLKIIDGKAISINFLTSLKKDIEKMKLEYNIVPHLCIIQVGDNQASNLYIQNKIARAKSLEMNATHLKFDDDVTESELIDSIHKINGDNDIDGVIVQLPLPNHISVANISESIDPKKDVDGFHPINLGYLLRGESKGFVPCTPLGCLHILKHYDLKLESEHIVIIGRSNIVGRPLASLLTNNNSTVTLCHSYTKNLQEITLSAKIVISAIGQPRLLNKSYFQKGAAIIDVGINKADNGKFVGDVDFHDVINKVSLITPVPGGVGPMTVAYLMSNLYKATSLQILEKYK